MRNLNKKTREWPEGCRECTRCLQVLPLDCFGLFKTGARGRYPICNDCKAKKAKQDREKETPEYKLYNRARGRARKKGLAFTISREDIKIPLVCPVFGVKMVGKYVPSLDRIDPRKGYTPENIQVISNRANMLKSNASVEELKQLVSFLETTISGPNA